MASRAEKGGGTAYPLTVAPGGYSPNNAPGTGAAWFGPGTPPQTAAPPQVSGRAWDFPSGYNTIIQPRAYQAVGFETLRAFADCYDLLRIVIETRKDEMERLRWNIVPRDSKKKIRGQLKERIETIEKFFRRPDRKLSWNRWLRKLLEDLFVIDAVSIHRRRTRGKKLYSLEQIDGGTIKTVLSDMGRTPEPPFAAYQQILKGMPAINYTTDDLLYLPRNQRVNKAYGFSPVEQIIATINIALRRQVFQINFFTEGNMPEALIGVPEQWTPDQIRAFQEWFDLTLSGNLAARSKARFVPNAVGKTYIPTKETELFGKAEEWLARVVCYAFSTSPQPFLMMMNRATADSAKEEATSTGLVPIKNWVKEMVDTVIAEDFQSEDLEFEWKEDDDIDPVKKQQMLSGYLKEGALTLNEVRQAIGKDPYPDERFNQPLFLGSNGMAPLLAEENPDAQRKLGPDGKPLKPEEGEESNPGDKKKKKVEEDDDSTE